MNKPALFALIAALTGCAGTAVDEPAAETPEPTHTPAQAEPVVAEPAPAAPAVTMVTLDPAMNTDQLGGFIGAAGDWERYDGALHFAFQVGPCEAKPCAKLGTGFYADGVFQLSDSDDLTVRREAHAQIAEWLGRPFDPTFFGPACDALHAAAGEPGASQSYTLPKGCGADVAVAVGNCARITFSEGTGRHFVGYERDYQHECAMVKANDAALLVNVSSGSGGWLKVETAAIPADQPDSCTLSCD